MTIRFVCLANSIKEGGRCLAGIQLNNNNDAIIVNNGPKWIRPICKTQYAQVYTHWVTHIKLLDIVEIESTGFPKNPTYQSENLYFKDDDLKVTGKFDYNKLSNLCDDRPLIFGNWGKVLSEEEILFLDHSLLLLKVNQFEFSTKTYSDKSKVRISFFHQDIDYDFPVTDPVLANNYQQDPDLLKTAKEIYLCVSIGIGFQGQYYKLVAGVI
jgi:hypothetical protein